MKAKYDTIGIDYSNLRRPDPRIAAAIEQALGNANTVLNVGAGAGSYEPLNLTIAAIEPSIKMINQRPPNAVKAIQGSAENLPFEDDSFDASMAILTIHHWTDQKAGLQEMRRVTTGPVVLLTFDPAQRPWLTDYLPELAILDDEQMPALADYERWLGPVNIESVPVPHDCQDGFLYAYWRRPEAYLDPKIRPAISSFWTLENIDSGLARLQADLESGDWSERYSALASRTTYDAGYRLIVSP